jgi:hypothetical protein
MRLPLAAVLIIGCITIHRARPQARAERPHYTDIAGRSTFSYITNNGFTGRKYFPQPLCGGVAVLDYDNDGWPDIFLTNGASFPDLKKTDSSFYNILFECISMETKGSPEGYNAETGFCEPAQKPQSGEPNEHQSLYRIRHSHAIVALLRLPAGLPLPYRLPGWNGLPGPR